MVSKSRVAPRKKPSQTRAIATVDAILQAAAYILVKDGWVRFNTNRVAERAGVNIASLYQYFPNKESLVAELQRRHVETARAHFPAALQQIQAQNSLHAKLGALVQSVVDEHRVEPALHRVFSQELPRSVQRRAAPAGGEAARQWDGFLNGLVQETPDPALGAFVVQVVLHAVVHEAACERPELLANPAFVDEVATLLERFLRRGAGSSRRSARGPR